MPVIWVFTLSSDNCCVTFYTEANIDIGYCSFGVNGSMDEIHVSVAENDKIQAFVLDEENSDIIEEIKII